VSAVNDSCDVAVIGILEASLDDMAALRKCPGPPHQNDQDFSCLKYADEHTVLGLGAVLHALTRLPRVEPLDSWGVIAAPRWPGRLGTAHAIAKYRANGPRSISPVAVPNLCMHAMSGTISMALGMHGPNFGVGGGLASVADGLLAGLVVQLEHRLPGTWLVLSEWDVEPGSRPDDTIPTARALALALVTPGAGDAGWRLRLQATASPSPHLACPRLAELTQFLAAPRRPERAWSCTLDWGMELVVTGAAA
jgi:hypothetical protein